MIKWYKKPTKKNSDAVQVARGLFQALKIYYAFVWEQKEYGGLARSRDNFVVIILINKVTGKANSIQQFLSCVCHEAAHILNYRNKKFFLYHNNGNKKITRAEARILLKTAWNAERYTDKVAKQLMKDFFPFIPYVMGYRKTPEMRKWYDNIQLEGYRKILRGENK